MRPQDLVLRSSKPQPIASHSQINCRVIQLVVEHPMKAIQISRIDGSLLSDLAVTAPSESPKLASYVDDYLHLPSPIISILNPQGNLKRATYCVAAGQPTEHRIW